MIDAGRLSALVSRPGIDPRIWVSLAICNDEPEVDGGSGAFVDVTLIPSRQVLTARVGSSYSGGSFGAWSPLHKDDEVVVVLPSGDPMEGAVVVARLWSPADKPPADAASSKDDSSETVQSGKNKLIKASGGGSVNIEADLPGAVRLGSRSATEAVLKGDTYRTAEDVFFAGIATTFTVAAQDPLVVALFPIMYGAFNAFAATFLTPFMSASLTYKSQISKTA